MKELIQEVYGKTAIIQHSICAKSEYKDGQTVIAYINDEERQKGQWKGIAKHGGKVDNITIIVPEDSANQTSKLISIYFSADEIMAMAKKIQQIRDFETEDVYEPEYF
jgi:hypothetical protein